MIEDTAVLEDMDEEEFSRLCEYAYSGTYKVPVPNSDPPKLSVRPEGDAFQIYRFRRVPLATCLDTYKGEHIELLAQEYGQPPKVYINNPSYGSELSDKDWTETLLRHANMYIIADRYDVAGLRQLACFYLHHILHNIFRDTWDSIPAIEKLVRLTYENTEPEDDLRSLVAWYVALLSETIFLHPNMDELRDEYDEFCSDVLKLTTERLAKETKDLSNEINNLSKKLAEKSKRNEDLQARNNELEDQVEELGGYR
ncbi:hypothetical protein ABKA04_008513 [Annulohypoxylon sp. FPYF3050]